MRAFFLGLCSLACFAFAACPDARALSVEKNSTLRTYAKELVREYGFSASQLRQAFRCAKIRPEIIEAMERPKELLPWYEYKSIFLTEENIRRGVQFWKKHAAIISLAHERYGVTPEIIVAIIGMETQFGRNTGGYPIIDALSTLMLDYPPRSTYFRKELTEYLLLSRELNISPCSLTGSYAGAMGLPQFMPSSYRRYAVDFDDDGKRDLLASPEDAIGSVAFYLKEHGWEADAPVADDVHLEGTLYFWIEKLGLQPALPARQLTRYGIFPRRLDNPERRGALISLEGEYGPIYRVGYNNFYVITRYNNNKQYAMAVYELAEMIRLRAENISSP